MFETKHYINKIGCCYLQNFFSIVTGESGDGVGERLLANADSEYDQLTKENVATILSYGDNFMDTVCRDACDGHDVGRVGIYRYHVYMVIDVDCFMKKLYVRFFLNVIKMV